MNGGYWGRTKPPAGVPIDFGHPLGGPLLGSWIFAERSGSRIYDGVEGHVQAGALTGSANWTPRGFNCAGANYFTVNDNRRINPTKPTTIEVICTNNTDQQFKGVFKKYLAANDASWGIDMFFPNNQIRWWFTNGWDTGVAVQSGVRNHLVGTADGVNQRFYLNGVLVASRANSDLPTVKSGNLRIGLNWDGNYDGVIEAARLYNRALSAAEIASLYAAPYQMFAPPVWRRFFVPQVATGLPPGLGPDLAMGPYEQAAGALLNW